MNRRTRWLATVGASALMAAGVGSQAAKAFDHVYWEWDKYVYVNEYINIYVNDNFDFSGLVEIEKWQLSFGDIKAKATVHDISNNPPGQSGFSGAIDETFTFNPVYYDPAGNTFPCTAQNVIGCTSADQPGIDDGSSALTATLLANSGFIDEQGNLLYFSIKVTGDPSLATALNAADLPWIKNAATAVANNQSVVTTTALQVHDLQVAAGDIDPYYVVDGWAPGDGYAWNSSHGVAALVILGALYGVVDPAHITAEAKVYNILNAAVDNAATAVANNISLTLNASTPGDGYLIGDITQLLIGDVKAKAYVHDVTINNYAGFGAAGFGISGTPIVSNIATAVGNNVSIKVDNCTLCQVVVEGPPL